MNKEFRGWLESEIQYLEEFEYANVVEFRILRKLERIIKKYDELHKPVVIPKYVAEWIEDIKPDNSLREAFKYIDQRKADNYDDPLAFWIEEENSETFARAWLDGFTIASEDEYI